MQLAAIRYNDRPEDALFVYRLAIEPLVNQTNNQAYQEAIKLLVKVKDLMSRLNHDAEFNSFLNYMKATCKRKRNFIKFLHQEKML